MESKETQTIVYKKKCNIISKLSEATEIKGTVRRTLENTVTDVWKVLPIN